MEKIPMKNTVLFYGGVAVVVAGAAWALVYFLPGILGGTVAKVADAAGAAIKTGYDKLSAGADALLKPLGDSLAASNTSDALQSQQTYLQARSTWFAAHGLSGSDAADRAAQPDFPQESAWLSGAQFPAY